MLEPNVKQKEAAEWYNALSKLLQGSKAVVSIDVGSTHYGDRAPREYGSLLRSVVTSSTITSIKFRDLAFGTACKDPNPAKSPSLAPDMVTSAIQKICFMEKGPMRNSEFLETIFSLSNFSNIRDLTITTKLRMETNGYSLPNSNPGFWRSIRRLPLECRTLCRLHKLDGSMQESLAKGGIRWPRPPPRAFECQLPSPF